MNFSIKSDKARLFTYFILLSFLGSWALQIPAVYKEGKVAPYIDALFTSVSAICVTGLSSLNMDVYTNFGFFIIMILIELGGLGILTFISMFLAIPAKKVSLVNRKLVKEFFIEDVEDNPRNILVTIFSFTIVIQLIGAAFLIPAFYAHHVEHPIFYALFLSVSAFCNAGFSPYSDSLASFQNSPYINFIVAFLIISGGLGFITIKNLFQVGMSKQKRLSLHSRIVLIMSATLIFTGWIFILCIEWNFALANLPITQKISAAFFQSVTTRTAGFETIQQANFSAFTSLYTTLLMFIGGSPGSIAGGVKTTTIFLVLMYALFGNDENISFKIFDRKINTKITGKALLIITQSLILLMISILLLSICEGVKLQNGQLSFLDIFFESISAFATVGLSRGITTELSFAGKCIIILTMFIGRTGIFAMALRLKQDKTDSLIQYPEEPVLVG
ncbi:MAG: TrkH family potassium uptake protein [Treponemataceae bacterium]